MHSGSDLGTGAQNEPHAIAPGLRHAEKHPRVMSGQAEVQPLQALLRVARLHGLGPGSQAHFKVLISVGHPAVSAETLASKSVIRKAPSLSI